ncbi:phosphorylase b kinase regulatory subunit beta [Platysternon megacephalum]|uniref:Phosphorylase b kinase regulatory subunit beta n=1 Tax=Platysternon megacephalum TaxID=55544 RepID=A0A4D9EFT4_9SAUR|nr:phosphorylase b kinase regulatory subunit beta [Platysternon megacephalum]
MQSPLPAPYSLHARATAPLENMSSCSERDKKLLPLQLACLPLKRQNFYGVFKFAAGRWAQICDGNPLNSVRGCDKYGCGYYGAPRNGRKHLAVDVKCQDGSGVYAPFSGLIVRRIKPFGNNNAIDDGILLREVKSGSCIKLAFIRPLRSRGWIRKGSKIGVMLPMQSVYPDISSHVRIQNCDYSNPTGNL